ncbi:uncharacterized protein LOC120420678 isoform X1 [Culex pipiens pallens]|uniref:uncharacterized protein LOC120420678 isoform X1 n=1 Tax=Culex pipiens pallens TaxID=42434 RepID=UPI0022AA6C8D|nr:uncharacterized protein LOC120420678 isoform X1 [Culex pipiens pallens]XP_052566232.1 uncharacterized protein LOC120420678 isoform X1 [Culex pipiens pallens]
MDSSPMKNNRKVRFSLPDNNIPVVLPMSSSSTQSAKQRLSHGTLQYVNGTLVSQPAPQLQPAGTPQPPLDLNRQVPAHLRAPKAKEPGTKIVLHLRPSTGVERFENVEVSPKPAGNNGGTGPLEKGGNGKKQPQKSSHPRLEPRTFKMLPQINPKFPSSDELTNGGPVRDACHRHKSSEELGKTTDANNNVQHVKKQTLMLRSLSSVGGPNGSAKSLATRPRAKSVGKINAPRGTKTLISPHLQTHDSDITIKVLESSPARRPYPSSSSELTSGDLRRYSEPIDSSSMMAASAKPVQKFQFAKCNFLTVPEFSDRFEGMETVVSTSGPTVEGGPDEDLEEDDDEEEEDEEEQEQGGGEENGDVCQDQEGNKSRVNGGRENRINGNGGGGVNAIEAVKTGRKGLKRNGSVDTDASTSSSSTSAAAKAPSHHRLDDAGFKCIQDTNLGRDKNSLQFWDFVERWRANRALKKLNADNFLNGCGGSANGSVQSGSSGRADVRSPTLSSRIRALRMSMEQVPTVTTLLRASRDANEYLLKEVFRDILENGISRENLNSTDRSGRTAISYICSTNLTNFLELFLQLPGIDVNKPDNEGNSPLHFAAQAGLSDIVNMLITKCRSLVIDPKNNLGFTPLMKAALQGRTRCAKLLLFAGASPVETDTGRGFRAEQWARFCGRHTCAETIEQCARARLLDKSAPCGKWSHDINLPGDKGSATTLKATRSSSIAVTSSTTNQNGLRSKFRKVFPFNFSTKDKQVAASKEGVDENYTKDLVNYLKSATICVSGPALSANRKIIQSLIRPLEVPKLEVTYAHNNALIKKYEASPEAGSAPSDDPLDEHESAAPTVAPPPLPPRAKV